MPTSYVREQLYKELGHAIGRISNIQAMADEGDYHTVADDLWMIVNELLRIRKSLYSPKVPDAQLVLTPHGDRSSRDHHPPQSDRPA